MTIRDYIERILGLLDASPPIQTVDFIRRRDRLIRSMLLELLDKLDRPALF